MAGTETKAAAESGVERTPAVAPATGAAEEEAETAGVQASYARVLEVGTRSGFALMVATFAIYVLGLVPPAIPIADLPLYWGLDAGTYLETVNDRHLHREAVVTGWEWTTVLYRSDFLNFLGIALLSAVTILCYLWILPSLLRRRDRAYAAMAGAEILVLALAASGILRVGH